MTIHDLTDRPLVELSGNSLDWDTWVRTSNLGPGGGVMIGDENDEGYGYIQIGVQNFYVGNRNLNGLRNLQNRFQVLDADGNDIIDVPMERAECYALAQFFLAVANREDNW